MKKSRLATISMFAWVTLTSGSLARADIAAEQEAAEYMQTWEERGREACKDNERGCAAAGHALDRAAAAYEKAGNLEKAIAIRKMILDPKWHLDYTDYGRTAAFTLARNYQSIAEYAESAQTIETAVRRFAKSSEAPEALLDAVILRLGMGEIDRAIEDHQLFSKNYGAKRSIDVAQMAVAIGTALWDHGQAKESLGFVQKWMPHVDRHGSLHHRILFHALLGRLHAHEGAMVKAAAEYEIVRAAWSRPEEATKAVMGLGGPETEQLRRLGQALTGVGEALFFFAEQKRAEVEALRFPEYTGLGDKDSVLKFVGTNVSEWFRKKNTAIEETEREYRKILELQPAPPPRWVIAAGGRVGFMWSSFVADMHRAPMPKQWNSSAPLPGTSIPGTEIKKMYLEQLSSMSEPLKQRSKQAFRVCVNDSVKFQWVDEHVGACISWLEKNYPKEWIPVEERKPRPMHLALPISTSIIAPLP